jgi:urease accessory protein
MSLLSLLQLSDPALPIGGYAHSGGLETYVQGGMVCDPASAGAFVRGILQTSVRFTDAALMVLAYRAGVNGDYEELSRLDGLCEAVKLPREIRESSRKLGGRLMKIFERQVHEKGLRHYCVVFGHCAASLGIELQEALTGFYYNTAAGMVTNCVKLIPMGQQDGQVLLFSLQALITDLVRLGLEPDRDMIGMSCAGLDIRCMQHERLYSRLYMS